MAPSRRVFCAVMAAGVLTAAPGLASAEWLISGYVGASRTRSTTLRVTPDDGTPFDVPSVELRGEAWTSPIYYGYRIGWQHEESPFGIEAEFTHAKTIAVDTQSAALTQFEHSHGLNFVLANVTYRSRSRCNGRCVAVGRVGAGFTIPHVEATYLGRRTSSYQFGGPAAQGGAGLEVTVHRRLIAVLDGRVTYTSVTDDLNGATLSAPFMTWHVTIGVGWRFCGSVCAPPTSATLRPVSTAALPRQ